MSKKIVGDDGKTYVQKKPIYKRVWFWILAIVVIAIFSSAMSGGSDKSSSKSSNSTQSTKATDDESSSSEETVSSSSSEKPKVSAEFTSALTKATQYANMMNMSKAGIYDQLTSDAGEQFPADAAQYAVDNVKADWNKNALEKAKQYQSKMSMSAEAIRDQLTSEAGEKFTQDEANYAIQHLNDNQSMPLWAYIKKGAMRGDE